MNSASLIPYVGASRITNLGLSTSAIIDHALAPYFKLVNCLFYLGLWFQSAISVTV